MTVANNSQLYFPQVDREVDPKVTVHFQRIYPALNDHNSAIVSLNARLNSLLSSLKYTTNGTEVVAPASSSSSSSSSGVTATQAAAIAQTQASNAISTMLGPVNNQSGISYTTQSSDYGGIITFNNAAAVAVTLNNTVNQQWYTALENLGSGTVTVSPQSGMINGTASLTVPQNGGALVFYDGVNFWAVPIAPPSSGSGVTSINGETGAITLQSSGATITITEPSAGVINLETAGGGGGPLTGNGSITVSGTSGSYSSTTITVPGATTSMFAVATLQPGIYTPGTMPTLMLAAAVTSANTVTVTQYTPAPGGGGTANYPISVLVFA